MCRRWCLILAGVWAPLAGQAANHDMRPVFEPNAGQMAPAVEWVVRSGAGAPMFLRSNGAAVEAVPGKAAPYVVMRFEGACDTAPSAGEEPLESYSNYYLGRDERRWFTGVPHFARVRYRDIYPGIDVVYRSNGAGIEYDFEVRPGADPSQIRIVYDHLDGLRAVPGGGLVLASGGGELRQRRPEAAQDGAAIEAGYRIRPGHRVDFALGRYDHSRPLLIDPALEFASYLGGPGDEMAGGIQVDSQGDICIAGASQSQVSPTLNPFSQSSLIVASPYIFKFSPDGSRLLFFLTLTVDNRTYPRGLAVDSAGNLSIAGMTTALQLPLKNPIDSQFRAQGETAFATKWTADGRSIVFSTYFGGSVGEDPFAGAAVDSAGNLYFAGSTASPDLPMLNALQPVHAGGTGTLAYVGTLAMATPLDCFLVKLSPAGQLIFSTYLGGSGDDLCQAMALGPDGSVVLSGITNNQSFPLVNAIQSTIYNFDNPYLGDAFVTRIRSDGQALLFSTFFGGSVTKNVYAAATDAAGNIYVGGNASPGLATRNAFLGSVAAISAFAAKFDSSGRNYLYSTYLSNSPPYVSTTVTGLAIAADESAYIAGYTQDPGFPLKNPLQSTLQATGSGSNFFLSRLAPSGSSLMFSTYLGGSGTDAIPRILLGPSGGLYLLGNTTSANFPVKNAFQTTYGGGQDMVFLEIADDSVAPVSPLSVGSGALAFQFVQGGATPDPQTVTVKGAKYQPSTDSSWLAAALPGNLEHPVLHGPGVGGAERVPIRGLQVSVAPTGLAPGLYHGTVTVTDESGDTASIQVALTVLGPAPRLDSVAPSAIAAGSGNTVLTFQGDGFAAGAAVLLNGVPGTFGAATVDNPQSLHITVPKAWLATPGILQLSVANPQSAASGVVFVRVQ